MQAAKVALGERGPVWWTDGEPDYKRRRVKNTPYADWFDSRADSDANDAETRGDTMG